MIRTFDRVISPWIFCIDKIAWGWRKHDWGSQMDESEGERGFWDTRAEILGSIWSRVSKATRLS